MDVSELETVTDALKVLEAHGYADAAEAVKDVLVSEFAKVAESVRESGPR